VPDVGRERSLWNDGYTPSVEREHDAVVAVPESPSEQRGHRARTEKEGEMRAIDGRITGTSGKGVARRAAIIVAASAVVIGASGGGAAAAEQSAWQKALHIRSGALNRHYAPLAQSAAVSDWRRGLRIRSEALNAIYDLGGHAVTLRRTTSPWQIGLAARSDALNRAYGLGTYAGTP
jgi:hypothetical protein